MCDEAIRLNPADRMAFHFSEAWDRIVGLTSAAIRPVPSNSLLSPSSAVLSLMPIGRISLRPIGIKLRKAHHMLEEQVREGGGGRVRRGASQRTLSEGAGSARG